MEVSADEMVIKSDSEEEMLADIKETLKRLRADPSKVKEISDLQPPKLVSEIQSLGKKLAAINRFLSKGVDKTLPFMRTLKNYTSGKMVQWMTKADEAFRRMKELLEALPTVTAPVNVETLIVYLAASKEAYVQY
ncbi:hypothetical protein Tco_0671883 [Tanacetum coccineum]